MTPERRTSATVGRRRRDRVNAEIVSRGFSVNPGDNWYRDILILLALGLMFVAILVANAATDQATRAERHAVVATRHANAAVRVVQQGRGSAITATCAVMNAVIDAGTAVIVGPTRQKETPFDRFLERAGYPPRAVRVRAAKAAAAAYAKSVTGQVDRQLLRVGVSPPPHLIRSDGTVNCAELLALARVSSH